MHIRVDLCCSKYATHVVVKTYVSLVLLKLTQCLTVHFFFVNVSSSPPKKGPSGSIVKLSFEKRKSGERYVAHLVRGKGVLTVM